MKSQSIFQIVLIVVFTIFIAAGIFLFATRGPIGGGGAVYNVEIWGTLDGRVMDTVLNEIRDGENGDSFSKVTYKERDPRTFDDVFTEAMAEGRGPDLVLLPHTSLLRHRNKLVTLSYDNISERDFKDDYIEEAELYLFPDGVLAIPITIDPMVMYWNRDLFSSAGIAEPMRLWEERVDLADKLIERDEAGNIRKAFLALGEFSNVQNAKDILSTLIMQAGGPVTEFRNGSLESVLAKRFDFTFVPTEAAVKFYTEFSNPVSSLYTWNRSLPNSRDAFVAGDLAVYFGYASELALVRQSNPNLNFDIATMPQPANASPEVTYGVVSGLSITRQAVDATGAFIVARTLSGKVASKRLSTLLNLPPVRRDLLSIRQNDAYLSVFYDSAIMTRGWLDPDYGATSQIFKTMIESVTTGRENIKNAVDTADRQMEAILR